MKTKLLILLAVTVCACPVFFAGINTLTLLAQVSVPQPLTELNIPTNLSTNLNASNLRMTFSDVRLNPTNFVPIIAITIELWNNEDPPLIIAKKTFTPTAAQMAMWYSNGLGTNSAKAWLKAALLNKSGLTERTP